MSITPQRAAPPWRRLRSLRPVPFRRARPTTGASMNSILPPHTRATRLELVDHADIPSPTRTGRLVQIRGRREHKSRGLLSHGNHGTTVPGPRGQLQWVGGLFNLALEFLGTTGLREMPPAIVTTARGSVLMWINTTQGDAANNDEGMALVGRQTSAGDGYGARMKSISTSTTPPTRAGLLPRRRRRRK